MIVVHLHRFSLPAGDGLASPVPPPVDDAYDTYAEHDEAEPAEADDDAAAEAEEAGEGDEVEHDGEGDANHKAWWDRHFPGVKMPGPWSLRKVGIGVLWFSLLRNTIVLGR